MFLLRIYIHTYMSQLHLSNHSTQNNLLLSNLMDYYNDKDNLIRMMKIINGESPISLRIVDWFVTNYSKKNFVVYELTQNNHTSRFKVFNDYKLKLKAYSKKRFDPFCRWERITIPYDNNRYMETTIGQLNFFKWALQNNVIRYIEEHYKEIEADMNNRNTSSKKNMTDHTANKTRKKREELSISACKCIKKEDVKIVVSFNN
jgi:hypothetical protein